MLSIKKMAKVFGSVLMLVLLLAGCGNGKEVSRPTMDDADKLVVFVSILPQADFVRHLGGDKVEVNIMMPPGVNEHNYEPDSGQLKELSKADLYIQVGGLPFEDTWMERLISANGDMLVVDSGQGIERLDHNPHIWLSPRLVKVQAQHITAALVQLDPGSREYFETRQETFLQELDALDREIVDLLREVEGKSFLVYHPAWGYFARDYGLNELGIEEHGKEPGAATMAAVIEQAQKDNIRTVFASSQHSTRSAEAVAAELGGKVVVLDPLPASYIDNMRQVAATMARELGAGGE